MAIAQGTCPNCGAPIEYGVGSSLAKVCEYCQHTVLRSDRGLEDLGKVADLADTPSLIAVDDEGTLGGRQLRVMGRVQLDHGRGPWDEYYVAFDQGQNWGWLAYAEGHWYTTSYASGVPAPPFATLALEQDVPLGSLGTFRVTEVKSATIASAEGELPGAFPTGFVRHYADLYGQNNQFATLDYGDQRGGVAVFVGHVFAETELSITALGPRSIKKVKTTALRCPNCGGDVPKLSGDRALRLGCPYCGAVSDIAAQRIIARQEAARAAPDIPVSSRGALGGTDYLCIAYLRRGSDFDGEHYTWEEYLLFNQEVGFRWLVKDPESGWSWVEPVNLAELDLGRVPSQVSWRGHTFRLRNTNTARVEYVLGEVYWKCAVGDTTDVRDFVSGRQVLSREQAASEVRWSHSVPIAWAVIAQAFGLSVTGPGGRFPGATASGGSGGPSAALAFFIVIVVLLMCAASTCESESGSSGGVRGGGIFYGGK